MARMAEGRLAFVFSLAANLFVLGCVPSNPEKLIYSALARHDPIEFVMGCYSFARIGFSPIMAPLFPASH